MNDWKTAMSVFACPAMVCCALLVLAPGASRADLVPLDDTEMDDSHAQGLFWSDKIAGNELASPSPFSTPFTFYRVGLDAEMAMNLNISKLQLGCGGINDYLSAYAGCDIDIDYTSLMGRSGSVPGNPLSAFVLRRPYMEFAIKNDGTANREIVGIKIGAESADGAMSVGRRYTTNTPNQENNDLRSGKTQCDPGASQGNGVAGCHSGVNSLSGFLNAEMSVAMRVQAAICTGVILFGACIPFAIPLDAWGCIGRTQFTGDDCGNSPGEALYVDIGGTRLQSLRLQSANLRLEGQGLSSLITAILGNAYAQMEADLRLLHRLNFEETGDFFLSFQREPVAYPRYTKMTPVAELTSKGTLSTAYDACASTSNFQTLRCNTAYAVPANTGWWLNAPNVKLLDVVNPGANLGLLSLGDALSFLGAPGLLISQPEFNISPSKNCYGATRFC
jgi:hypothetical protein